MLEGGMMSKLVKKYSEEIPELQEVKKLYTHKCEELFGKIEEVDSEDMIAFQELVLEAMAKSPAAVDAIREFLIKRKNERDAVRQPSKKLVIDEHNLNVIPEDIFKDREN
jgi:hypothetical protein